MMNQNGGHDLRNSKELNLKEKWTNDDDDLFLFFSFVCQFVQESRATKMQLFPCLCQFSTLMFPPCCAIGNHWKVSNDVHNLLSELLFAFVARNTGTKSGTETWWWFAPRRLLFFVVVTNFEALCFHRNLPRRDDEVCYSPAGFFSSKMKTNWRLFSFPIPPEKAAMNSFVSGIH